MTLATNDKYSCHKRQKFLQAIQMQLFKKPKTFYEFFSPFWNLHKILNISKKKDEAHSSTISDIIDSERSCYLNVLEAMF